jgi:hypothetical protein
MVYLEVRGSQGVIVVSHALVMLAEELQRLRNRCHRLCGTGDLLLDLAQCEHPLSWVGITKSLVEKLHLLLELLVLLRLSRV